MKTKKEKITQSRKSAKKSKPAKKKNKKSKLGVTRNTTFMELMQKYPESAEILMNRGMHCIGCGMAGFETIEQGAMVHGLNPEELVNEINKKLEKKK